MFRRVRDEHGQLHLSQNAKAFHPGRGVYRSSYMNARRLAATETNIAYRTADHERWQQMDFVVGIEIHLSNNHNCKGVPVGTFYDICDELKGKYPKDFKFTGWHPHCRCYATTILKTEDEVLDGAERILAGDEPTEDSVNTVTTTPECFNQWIANNATRTVTALSIPYFMSDNPKYVAEAYKLAAPGRTSLSFDMMKQMPYLQAMKDREPRLTAIWHSITSDEDLTDIEKSMLLGKARTICSQLTYADLQKWGVVDKDCVMQSLERNFEIQKGGTLITSENERVPVKQMRKDMIIIRDKHGKQFAYPTGILESEIIISVPDASEVIHDFPPVLRAGIKRVSFIPEENGSADIHGGYGGVQE